MGTWWNPKSQVGSWIVKFCVGAAVVAWVIMTAFNVDTFGFGTGNPFWYILVVLIGLAWLCPFLSSLWLILSLVVDWKHRELGIFGWSLVFGVVVGMIPFLATILAEPDLGKALFWFLIGSGIGWYGPGLLIMWVISLIFS